MDISSLIQNFKSRGVTLWAEGGKLKFRAANGTLSAEDKATLKEHKSEIIAFFENDSQEDTDSFPLTPIQKSYLVGRDETYDLGGINTHYYLELEMNFSIDVEKLSRAWNQVIQKDDALRLVIFSNGRQKVLSDVPEYKIEEVTFATQAERLQKREEWNHHIYALAKWPFFTLRVSHVAGENDVLHFDFDCMIMDAWSAKIAIFQMFRLYRGEEVNWPSYTFKEYCDSVKDYEAKQDFSAAEAFWKGKAKELVCEPKLPYARPLSEIHHHRFSRLNGFLDKDEYKALLNRAREYRTTPAAIISTAYLSTLLKYSKDDALTINSTVFNRLPLSKEINEVVGDFTNIAFLTLSKDSPNFLSSLQTVQKDMWQLVRFHTYDGTKILKFKEGLQPMRAQMPVVITCVLDGGKSLGERSDMRQIYALSKTPQVVLDYQVTDFDGKLSVSWDYAVPAFEPETLKQMFNDNVGLLKRLLTEKWDEVI